MVKAPITKEYKTLEEIKRVIPSRDLHAFINKIVLKIKNTKPSKILSEYMLGFLDG